MKRGKAVGNDQIAVELLTYLGDTGVDILERLFNEMYSDGDMLMNFWNPHLYPFLRSRKRLNVGIIEQ